MKYIDCIYRQVHRLAIIIYFIVYERDVSLPGPLEEICG